MPAIDVGDIIVGRLIDYDELFAASKSRALFGCHYLAQNQKALSTNEANLN